MYTNDALKLAQRQDLDLVEITPLQPPQISVCKIMDYGKYRYDESIRQKQMRKNQRAVQQTKEIKFHPGTEDGDLAHKLKQIRSFLAAGNKVRLSLQFRGRENAHRDVGEDMIAKVLGMLKDECTVEQAPKTDGKVHFCLISPPRAKKGGGKNTISVAKPAAGGIQITVGAPKPPPAAE